LNEILNIGQFHQTRRLVQWPRYQAIPTL